MALFTPLQQLGKRIQRIFDSSNTQTNKFNEAFTWSAGGGYTQYDPEKATYIDQGYNVNPLVYAPISKMSTKTASIPYYIKKIDDKQAFSKLTRLRSATKMNLTYPQKVNLASLDTKAFEKEEMSFPLERPNPNQSWREFFALYKTFLKTTGDVFWFDLAPEDGANKGTPIASYLLPSHQIQIVLKPDADMLGIESPIKSYILTYGRNYIEFEADNVMHIKYSNPNYGIAGEHLYGQSPLKATLRNIQSSNTGIDLSIKTQLNGGAFGFIHGKNTPLTVEQASELKERMTEMDKSRENLSKIAGFSAEVGFTRISLTSDELKPFDYLNFDKEMIADCLDWAIIDGNKSDFGGTINEIRKQRVVDNIIPDLDLLTEKLNSEWLPKFKGYEGSVIEFDAMELPEMQDDLVEMGKWLDNAQDRGNINRKEYRAAIRFVENDDANLEIFTVKDDIMTLEEAINNEFVVDEAIDDIDPEKKSLDYKAGFDPNQVRDENGQWGSGGASNAETDKRKETATTGEKIAFRYMHNPETAPYLGSRFGQDVEAAGLYVTQYNGFNPGNWELGRATLESPLVIDIDGDNLVSYKPVLSEQYGGLTGRELSSHLESLGFDGIITRGVLHEGTAREYRYLGEIIIFDPEKSTIRD